MNEDLENKYLARWWHKENAQFQCDLCPRFCKLHPGQRGFCYVRKAFPDGIYLTTYGRSSGFCIDPIEKKPLYHFLPGTSILSFGTAGCNLGCKFCQNWDISKVKTDDRLMSHASPQHIVKMAKEYQCKSIAFTYNDPVIFSEYAIDTAIEAHQFNIKTVAVSAGYISETARSDFFSHMDAANIDLKFFKDESYKKYSLVHLDPILSTLEYIVKHTDTWLEITTLLIPGINDSREELTLLTKWISDHLGPKIPLHFSAFHPDFKMRNYESTPLKTLIEAQEIAYKIGLKYVYTGNIPNSKGESTYCPQCHLLLIERDKYKIYSYQIKNGSCGKCHFKIDGFFED